MNREEVIESIKVNVQNKNLIKHMLATEAIMRALARRFNENEEIWGITGLIHDIDVELTHEDMRNHSKLGADIVREMGASEDIVNAVLCHNEMHGIACETKMERALFCADPLTGLIIATTLVHPDKKLAGVAFKSVRKRFKEKGFAAGAKREQIAKCSELGLELDEFIDIGLVAMKEIAAELGL